MRRGKVFKVKGHNGWRGQKQINKTRFVKDFVGTKAECEAQCGEWLEMLENTYRNHWDGTLSWGQFKIKWREWATLETTAKEPMSRQSIKKYNLIFQTLERLIKPRYVRDITMQKLRYCRSILEQEAVKKGQDNHGVNHFVSCMRAAIKWGIDSGYMPEMDIENFHKVPTAKVVVKTNTIYEIETLLKYGSLKERIIVLLGFDCGCRPEEMCNLLLSKIDLNTRFAWISPNTEDKSKGIRKWTPKCGKTRQIRLTERLADMIKELNSQGPYLLMTPYGEAYTNGGFYVFYKKFLKRVNDTLETEHSPLRITGSCKTLRKDYCTSRQEQGAPKKMVSLSMGHSDEFVTTKHYTNAETEALRQKERERLQELDKYIVPLKINAIKRATDTDED